MQHPSPIDAIDASAGPAGGRIERIARQLLVLAAFSIPFSTALANLFVGLTLIAFVAALLADRSLARPLRTPAALLALALLALVLLGATWSVAPPGEVGEGMRKYTKLLVLPLALCLCRRAPGLPARVLYASLAGCGVLATSLYLVWLDSMPTSSLGWWRVGDMSDPYALRNHITIGILLSFAACASFMLATYARSSRARLALLGAGLYFGAPILMGNGRTGYVGLFIGLFALYLLRGRVTLLRSALVAAAMSLLFAGVYMVSPNVKTRMDLLVAEVSKNDATTPNGLRISFMKTGMQAVAARPLLGYGTGSFSEVYAPEAQRIWGASPETARVRHQPHSEPLLLAVQLGVPGVALYFALLGAIGKAALARRDRMADALALLLAIYGLTSLFNSLLWNPTEAYWFLLLAGALYGHCIRQRATAQ
ncbi:MAG: O-antigen ligase family protein [Telluria sp.]